MDIHRDDPDDLWGDKTSDGLGRHEAQHRPVVTHHSAASYEGRARLGRNEALDVLLRIQNVEDPNWTAVFIDDTDAPPKPGEIPVTLVDAGSYEGWSGSAVPSRGTDGVVRLLGHESLVPPVGASSGSAAVGLSGSGTYAVTRSARP